MALVKLSREEMRTFLDQATPTLNGVVGTLGEDASPPRAGLVSLRRRAFPHLTLETRAWVRNAMRDNRAGFSVHGTKWTAVEAFHEGPRADHDERRTGTEEIRRLTCAISGTPPRSSYMTAGVICAPS
jgi:hypothetical protein